MTEDTLDGVMEFDHVIIVHADGTITDAPNVYAPSLLDGELDSADWELLDGYSGQHGYSGPVMHDSEYIGGGMARDILSTPGTYVAIAAYYTDEDDDEGETIGDGWAVARLTHLTDCLFCASGEGSRHAYEAPHA